MSGEPGLWSSLSPIGLEALVEAAALDTRIDRKYVVPPGVIEDVLGTLGAGVRVLEIDGSRSFRYETVYFDTPHLDSYLAAARSRPRRYKVRTRSYLDSGLCALEVKTRDGRGRTVKHRRPHAFANRTVLTPSGAAFVTGIIGPGAAETDLRPVLVNNYVRQTVLVEEVRATIDRRYVCEDLESGGCAALPHGVIVETKSSGRPGAIDRLLWKSGYRPERISKYCTGLAAARTGLPANKWHRTLVRHMEAVGHSEMVPSRPTAASQAAAIPSNCGRPPSRRHEHDEIH